MSKKKNDQTSLMKKTMTCSGGYVGAKTGRDLALALLNCAGGKDKGLVIAIDLLGNIIGCFVGATLGRKSAAIIESLEKEESESYE